MNPLNIILIVALVALAIALFAWALPKIQNASPVRREKRLTDNRHFTRRHFRKFALLPLLYHRVAWWFGLGSAPRTGVQFCNIGEGTYSDGRKSYLADAATSSRYLLYKKGTDVDHVAITGAGDDPLGPSDDQAEAGMPIAINLLGAVKGTIRVVTDGTVDDGEYVKAGANGKVTAASTTDLSFGRAIIPSDCSKADGDVITIIPMAPAKYVF